MNSLRRFLVAFSYAFAFGGFVFYAGVVVPLGTAILGSTTQGFVTRQVTQVLNWATLICAALLMWECLAQWHRRGHVASRWLLGLTLWIACCSGLLFFLHPVMDALLDPEEMSVDESGKFYELHRVYLWTSTLQWIGSLPILWLLLNYPRAQQH